MLFVFVHDLLEGCWGVFLRRLRVTIAVADGLAVLQKIISNLAIENRNYTASLCGVGSLVVCSNRRVKHCAVFAISKATKEQVWPSCFLFFRD